MRWNRTHLRHVRRFVRRGRNPVAAVYDSLGADFFLAPAPGWLNLGLWEGSGDEGEAARAPERLVETLAADLPRGATVLDVGNGLGAQDPVIARVARPRLLVAINITESQLRAGASYLQMAAARPVVADASRLPVADDAVDGMICVEAAFHFPSRPAFFAGARRVLRPGGVLVTSDITAERPPRGPLEWLAGATSVRFWGLRRDALVSAAELERQLRAAGFTEVTVQPCGARVFDPMLVFARQRLRTVRGAPWGQVTAARLMIAQWRLLRRRGLLEYVLVRAR